MRRSGEQGARAGVCVGAHTRAAMLIADQVGSAEAPQETMAEAESMENH
jgi:hypothetical protein